MSLIISAVVVAGDGNKGSFGAYYSVFKKIKYSPVLTRFINPDVIEVVFFSLLYLLTLAILLVIAL